MKRHTQGTETSKYLEEKKTKVIPSVAASESGIAQTKGLAPWGCRTSIWQKFVRRSDLERSGKEGNSPVAKNKRMPRGILSTAGHVKPRRNPAGPSAKAKYYLATDSEAVP